MGSDPKGGLPLGKRVRQGDPPHRRQGPHRGFKVYRRRVLESIDLASLASLGYAFQVETTFRAVEGGFRVVEVPIVFRDRRVGESKMSGGIVLEAAWRVPLMRLRGR